METSTQPNQIRLANTIPALWFIALGTAVLALDAVVVISDAGYAALLLHRGVLPSEYILARTNTPVRGALLSLRAAIIEEPLFRLLLGSLITLGISRLAAKAQSETRTQVGMLITGALFCLLHPNWAGLVGGIGMSLIYFRTGLAPAMVVHFLADIVPYALMLPFVRR